MKLLEVDTLEIFNLPTHAMVIPYIYVIFNIFP